MPQADKVSDSDLLRLIDDEIASGISFANDLTSNGERQTGKAVGDRQTGLDYYDGKMGDLPAEKGRSSVVSRDVADVIDTMLPGLMRVFDGSDRVVTYAPKRPGDEEFAEQATDYVNHLWANDCDGYLVLQTQIVDALQARNGVVKAYWDHTPEHETEELTGLSDEQLVMLDDDPDVEIVGYRERSEVVTDPATGRAAPVALHDVKLKRVVSRGRLVVDNVPPEKFGISRRGGKTIDTAAMVWEESTKTRSDLVKEGHKRDFVWSLPVAGGTANEVDRDQDGGLSGEGHGANAEIDIVEVYAFVDRDGDGIAESRKIVLAGSAGSRRILSDEEWSDDRPFSDVTPQIVPHRWMGRSIADNVMDLQRVKTVLLRGTLDNIYAQNRPQREVVDSEIKNPDEVLNPTFGGVIRVKKPGMIREVVTPDIAGNTLQVMRAIDGVIERRTGVSGATASLDSTAIEPQTATAEQLEHDASYARVELVARNLAKLGLKNLFSKILRIVVRNQDRPRTIRLRDRWVEFDPRPWNASMDAAINIGLGTGSRERDLAMLMGVAAQQEKVIAQLGPDNPVVKPSMFVATLHKMVEASGLKNPEAYFARVSDDEFSAWQASRPPQTDPKADAAKAQIEAKVAGDRERVAAQIEGEREKAQADVAIERERMANDADLERDRLDQEFALRRDEMDLEARLSAVQIASGAHSAGLTNIARQ